MNIFFLSICPKTCALYHLDKHIVKMPLETAQLLCSAHWMTESSFKPRYKLAHKNHPSSIWTRESKQNYIWLCELGIELCKEYTYRYGKIHKCQEVIEELKNNIPENIPNIKRTPIKLAMPDEFKDEDPIEAYKNYYFFGKIKLHSWKKRSSPDFILDMYNFFNVVV